MVNAMQRVTKPQFVEPQQTKKIVARADAMPRARSAVKADWFGLRRQMLLRIAAIERMMPNLQAFSAGAAPCLIESMLCCDRDIEHLLAILGALPRPQTTAATRAIEAATRLGSFGERIKAQVVREADIFVSKASKLAASAFGRSDTRLLFHYVFADRLMAAAQAALDCLNCPAQDLELPSSWETNTDKETREINLQRPVFFEESTIGSAHSIKHSTMSRQGGWSTMSRAR